MSRFSPRPEFRAPFSAPEVLRVQTSDKPSAVESRFFGRSRPICSGTRFPRKLSCFPHAFASALCRNRRTGWVLEAFQPVFPLLKSERTTFLKLGHRSNPRLERFPSIFPLFRAKRLLLLDRYPYKSSSVAVPLPAADHGPLAPLGPVGDGARISYQKPSFPESTEHRFVTRMKR